MKICLYKNSMSGIILPDICKWECYLYGFKHEDFRAGGRSIEEAIGRLLYKLKEGGYISETFIELPDRHIEYMEKT